MVIKFVELGGEDQFRLYQKEFERLYPSGEIVEILGKKVKFRPTDAFHVCYKTDEDNWNGGTRSIWSLERAHRISWVKEVLQNPIEIHPNSVRNRYTYLTRIQPAEDKPEECFLAIIESSEEDQKKGEAYFVTAFPIDADDWGKYRTGIDQIYPELDEETRRKFADRNKIRKEKDRQKKEARKLQSEQAREAKRQAKQ